MSRFLIAASALTASALVQGANWIPTSPLIQVGNDCDIYFDAAASLEVTDNLYSSATKTSATSWMLTPGFLLEYGKDSALSATLSAKRTFVNFTDSALADLEDSRDSLSAGIRFADGGPLTLSVDSSYRVTARNDDLQMQGLGGILGATLVRQANYAHSFRADYKLTEKLSVGLGYSNTYNHYLDPVTTGTAGSYAYNTNTLTELNTKSMPLSFDYQAFEKLSFGLALQHDVTDYTDAPYYSEVGQGTNPATFPARPALSAKQLVKDFYGLTAKGAVTESGKLNVTAKVGYAVSRTDNLPSSGDPSYSVSVSHTLTELISHTLTFSRDTAASSSGGITASKTYTYGANFTAATDLTLNLSVTKSDVLSGATGVNTWVYTLGADYKYNSHLSLQAGYNFTDSKIPAAASANFTASTFTASAAFRY